MKFSSFFKSFLTPYLLILIIPLIAGLISYQASINMAQKHSINSSLLVLNQSKDLLDQRMSEINEFTNQLALNRNLNLELNKKDPLISRNVFNLWNTSQDIAAIAQTNNFLQNYYIYLRNYDAILTPNSVFYRKDHFYQMSHFKSLSYTRWEESILKGSYRGTIIPSSQYVENHQEKSVITYLQSLPLNHSAQSMGAIVVLIDQATINELLKDLTAQYNGWAYIAAEDGAHIASVGITEEEFNQLSEETSLSEENGSYFMDDETLIIQTESSRNGWVYRAGIPKQFMLQEANQVKRITLYIMSLTLIVGLLIGIFFAYRNSRPLHGLMDIMKDEPEERGSGTKGSYEVLHGKVAQILSNNQELESELKKQNSILEHAYLRRLINGEFKSLVSLKNTLAQMENLPLSDHGYIGIIKVINDEELEKRNELSETHILIKQFLLQQEYSLVILNLDSNEMVIFLTTAEQNPIDQEKIKHIFEQMTEDLSKYQVKIAAGFGGSFEDYMEISRSYKEARQTIDYALLTHSAVTLWYKDVRGKTDLFYFPMESEVRLINAIKDGEVDLAKKILTRIIEENFIKRKLFTEMTTLLIEEIRGCLIKSFDPRFFNNIEEFHFWRKRVMEVQFNGDTDELKRELDEIIETYCSLVADKLTQVDQEAINSIVQFLESSYSNPDLSLNSIAEGVGYSEKYVSQLFKEQTGMYLFDYLEDMRIKKAKELLTNTDETIEKVSSMVGYNSPHSFRRAFKRVEKVTPNHFRKYAK